MTWLSHHRNKVAATEITDKYAEFFNKSVVIKLISGEKLTDVILEETANNIVLDKFGILGKFSIKMIRLA